MKTERLQEFIVLAKSLNYTKAAESLFISQSILSKHIKELEKELQVDLFHRSTHSVTLTDEGKLLLRSADSFMVKIEKTTSLLAQNTHRAEGTIHLNCHEQTLCERVLALIKDFNKNYDSVDIDIHVIESAPDITAIEGADLLISPCDFMNKISDKFMGKKIYEQSALLAIPPYHHLGDRQEINLEELSDENLIVPFSDELFGPYSRNFFLAFRKSKGNIRKIPAFSPQDALLKVELGEGIMIIPHHLKRRLYAQSRPLRIIDEECKFPVYAYTKAENTGSAPSLFYNSL